MPRLVANSFAGPMNGYTERLLYVGFTRATKWLYLSTIIGKAIPGLDRVRKLSELKPPVVTLGRRSMTRPATENVPIDDPLDLL